MASRRNSSQAPDQAPEKSQAPDQAPAGLNIAETVANEEVTKAQKVYVDILERVPTSDGTLATVQREQRADGSLGELLLAEVRASKSKDQPDSITRSSIAGTQRLKDALEAAGHVLFT